MGSQQAILPSQRYHVAMPKTDAPQSSNSRPIDPSPEPPTTSTHQGQTDEDVVSERPWHQQVGVWQGISAFFGLLWLITMLGVLKTRRRTKAQTQLASTESASEQTLIKRIRLACTQNQPVEARAALMAWAKAVWAETASKKAHWTEGDRREQRMAPSAKPVGLDAISSRLPDPMLMAQLQALDGVIYGSNRDLSWNGDALWHHFQQALNHARKKRARDPSDPLPDLYLKAE